MFDMDVARSGITEDCGSKEIVCILFFSGSVEQPASDQSFKLVTEDELTREKLVPFERSDLGLALSGHGAAIGSVVLSKVGFTEAKSLLIQVSTSGKRAHLGEREVS